MSDKRRHAEVTDLLAAYVSGGLGEAERRGVAEHLDQCAECARQQEEWVALREAVRARQPAVSLHPALLQNVRLRVAPARPTPDPRTLLILLMAQAPLVRQQIWAASALVLTLGCLVALSAGRGGGSVLALLAPVVAAVGVGFIYGPGNDPPLELALATPTSPRLILLARLTLVCGYDLLLAILASLLVVGMGQAPGSLAHLISLWLGPMLLLSALSLWLSLWRGPATGVLVALAAWAVRVTLPGEMAYADWSAAAQLLAWLESTNVFTLGAAAAIAAAVVVWLPRQELTT
mgnify:CR=1 FL=1